MTSPRERSAARIRQAIAASAVEPPPSEPVVVDDGLVVWPDGRFIAALPAGLVDDG